MDATDATVAEPADLTTTASEATSEVASETIETTIAEAPASEDGALQVAASTSSEEEAEATGDAAVTDAVSIVAEGAHDANDVEQVALDTDAAVDVVQDADAAVNFAQDADATQVAEDTDATQVAQDTDATQVAQDGTDEATSNTKHEGHQPTAANDAAASTHKLIGHPWLGGYRDKRTNTVYTHAQTQTSLMAELRAAQAPPKFHRDTQTVDTRNRLVSTVTTRATQMTRSDLYVSTVTDRVIVPFTTRSAYETSEMWLAKIVHAAVRIQCFFRVRKAIWVVRGLREQRDRLSGEEQVRERKRQERLAAERRRQLEAKLHPHTAKDFEALYHALQQWSTTEKARINAEFGEHAGWKKEGLRLAKLADLVDQETALIQKLDALKTNANRDNHDAWIRSLLDHMASPRKLKVPSMQRGKPDEEVNMDTPNIIRARELRDLYFALVRHEKCTVDERLQVLLHVKHTVKEYDCRLTRDVVDLIDREGDLISRGRGASMLDGLRRRIGNLFLQFVRTPEFNPEAAKYSRVPVSFTAKSLLKKHQGETTIIKHRASNELEPTHSDDTAEESSQAHGGATLPSVNSTTGSQMYACRSCNKYLPSTEFFLHTTLKHLGKCKTCIMDDNFANRRENELGLQKMVDWIRADELRKMQVLRNLWDKYGVALGAILGNGRVYGGQSVSVTAAGSRSIGREFARAIGGYGLSGDALDALLEHTQHDEQTALELAERICECALSAGETAFTALMTDHDIHYMLETIWKGRSAMPQLAEPQGALVVEGADELTFTRWDPFMPFSPWNSILLTKAEAATHDRHALTVALQQLVQCTKAFSAASANPGASTAKFFTVPSATHALYSEQFVANVRSRHLLAKQHFAQLATMERRYLDKLLAGSAGDTVLNSDPSTLDAALNVASKKTDAATVADGAIAATDV